MASSTSWSWSFAKAAASVQAAASEAAAVAAGAASEAAAVAAGAAKRVKNTIEDELSSEYEATANSGGGPSTGPRAILHAEPPAASAIDRITQAGAAIFNPVEDAGGTPDELVAPSRIVMLPWEAPGLSESSRTRMRNLSQERSIFLAPPAGGHSSFRFDLEASVQLIMEALRVDKRLEEQRHLLVPVQVSEEQFFTNYFHHLHVIARGAPSAPSACAHAACDAGSSSDGRSAARSPTSSSPVLVSAAASDASDLARVADCEEANEATSVGGSDAPAALSTPLRHDPKPAAPSLEEQFEVLTSLLTPKTASADATAAGATARTPGHGAARTPSLDASPATAALPPPPTRAQPPPPKPSHASPATSASHALTSWEEELRAELG